MAEIKLIPYTSDLKKDWDDFLDTAKNATLLHRRDYLEYHSDRFPDASLLAYRNDKLFALLPATLKANIFSSHAGLTYGGLILDRKATAAEVLELMGMIRDYVKDTGATEFIYKPIPHIYHSIPAEEDLYALFRLDATLKVRNVSSVIYTPDHVKLRDDRKAGMRKAAREGIYVEESEDFDSFWKILTDNLLNRYNALPVHSLEEIRHLKRIFPHQIRLYLSKRDSDILGGAVVYLSPTAAHTQYISATPEGKRHHALDLLLHKLSSEIFSDLPYFDFGTSNEEGGRFLNENLISQKEGFGGRAVVYDTYSIPL